MRFLSTSMLSSTSNSPYLSHSWEFSLREARTTVPLDLLPRPYLRFCGKEGSNEEQRGADSIAKKLLIDQSRWENAMEKCKVCGSVFIDGWMLRCQDLIRQGWSFVVSLARVQLNIWCSDLNISSLNLKWYLSVPDWSSMPWEAALLLRVGASVLFTIIILYLAAAKVPCSLLRIFVFVF